MSTSDVQDWFGTRLGLPVFVRTVKRLTSGEEYDLLMRWASCREPHPREAEIERVEALAEALAALFERWDAIEVQATERSGAGQVE